MAKIGSDWDLYFLVALLQAGNLAGNAAEMALACPFGRLEGRQEFQVPFARLSSCSHSLSLCTLCFLFGKQKVFRLFLANPLDQV